MDNQNFRVIFKPDTVSFDVIADILRDAHESNRKQGMHFASAYLTGDEIVKHVGEDAVFVIAVNSVGAICGVGALKYRVWDKWFCGEQLCGDIMLIGVREQYKGNGLSTLICHKLETLAFQKCSIVTMNTASKNSIMLKSRVHDGWKYVDYFSHIGNDFYSIMLAKWKDKALFSKCHFVVMFHLRKAMVILMKKKNGNFRLWAKLMKGKSY